LNGFKDFVPENKDDVDNFGLPARMISENDLNKWRVFVKLMPENFFTVCRDFNECYNKLKYGSEVSDGDWGQKRVKHAIEILRKEDIINEEQSKKIVDGIDSIADEVKSNSFIAFFSWLWLKIKSDKSLSEEEKSLKKLGFSQYREAINKQKFKSNRGTIKEELFSNDSGFLKSTKETPDVEKMISKSRETQVKLETNANSPISKVNEKRADIVDQNYKKLLEGLRKKQTKKEEKEK